MNYYDEGYKAGEAQAAKTRSILKNVYLWMAIGLAITAAVAFYISHSPALLRAIFSNRMAMWIVFGAQIAAVIFFGSAMRNMGIGAVIGSFIIYAALMGVTMTAIMLIYPAAAIYKAFATTAGMFAVTSIFGYTTKRDLTSVGHFAFMGLIGVIIAMLVNMFLRSPMMDYIVSLIGVAVFTALTAYDTQRIAAMSRELSANANETDYIKSSLQGALILYLDFINMFMYLVRIFGRQK